MTKVLKSVSSVTMAVTVGLIFIIAAGTQVVRAQESTVVDRVVAIVESDIILKSDVDTFILSVLQQQQQNQLQYSDELWMEALEELINQRIMVEYAKRDTNIVVTDEQVSETLEQRLSQLVAQVGGEQQLEEMYGRTMLQIREEFREDLRNQILANQLQQQQMQDIRITPTEVREWFNQIPRDSLPQLPETVRLAHIVAYPEIDPAARNEARHMIEAIRDSIAAGTPIERMAELFSDDPGSASRGGHYPRMNISELVSEFGAVASTLEPGEISQIFETEFGYHIMRLNNRVGDQIDFNHVLITIDDTRTLPGDAEERLSAIRDSATVYNMPFEVLARRHSEEERSANRGGYVVHPRTGERDLPLSDLNLGWRRTINSLDAGEISEPRETELLDGRRAWHILKLQRHTPAHLMSLEMDYAFIREVALQDKRSRKLRSWLNRLRSDLYVQVLIDDPPPTTVLRNQ